MSRQPIGFRAGVLSGVVAVLFCSSIRAQNWEPIDDPDALRALFSDTVLESTLKSGENVVARYDRDGTGVVEAWGDTFARTWEIKGQDQVCINLGTKISCFTIERDTDSEKSYWATNAITGESLVLTISEDEEAAAVDSPTTAAGGAAKPSAEELAASLANPNTPLASLNFKLQFRSYEGDLPNAGDQWGTTLLFQPTLPFPLANGDTVFFRPAIPFQFNQPAFDADNQSFESRTGFGDTTFDLAYGRTLDNGVILAAGVISTIPTATQRDLGADRWTLGPEFLIGKASKDYVAVLFPNHQWDIGGTGDADINLTSIQPIFSYLPGGGWSVGTAPSIAFDHVADEWTVPVNANFGKTVIWNGRPWKLSMEVNYYVDKPDSFGPEWFVGFNIAPVVKNALADLF